MRFRGKAIAARNGDVCVAHGSTVPIERGEFAAFLIKAAQRACDLRCAAGDPGV